MTDINTFSNNPEAQKLLANLNEQQKQAVIQNDTPLVVFAGAGSGKTRVITTKLAWCIRILGIPSWKTLAVTFTNKACKEMKERVQTILPEVSEKDLCIKTFHSFGAMVLRRFGDRIQLNNNFKIYDDDDSVALLGQIFPNDKKTDLVPIAKKISLCKDKMILPEECRKDKFGNIPDFYRYYSRYQEALLNTGNVDFADLITRTIELLDTDPEVQQWIFHRFKVVLVDEYQDSNAAQCLLLKRIVGPDCFVCVVGDDDQSIYRFRGAEVKNILDFGNYFTGAQVIKLEQNYRSTKSVLNLASAVIHKNKARAPKEIWTDREEGQLPSLTYVESDFAEASYIAQILLKDGKYDSSAVLYRTNAQSATFESTFNKLRIPYKLVGALRFYDREEVKDVIAYLGILMNPRDSVSFARVINKPLRGIGPTSVKNIMDAAARFQGDLIVTCRNALNSANLVKISGTRGLSSFVTAYEKVQAMLGIKDNAKLMKTIITEFGLDTYYTERDLKEHNIDSKRVKNIEQVVNIIAQRPDFLDGIEGLNAFIEEASLDPTMMANDDQRKQTGVTLITMHNTKGLEFDRVFITGMEEGIFPSTRTETSEDLEEERRIFYVAITRARNELYLFSCRQRRMWGSIHSQLPSQFLAEIPQQLIKTNKSAAPTKPAAPSLFTTTASSTQFKSTGYGTRTPFSYPSYSGASGTSSFTSTPTKKPAVPSALLSKGFTPARKATDAPPKPSAPALKPDTASQATDQDFAEGDRVTSDTYGPGTITGTKTFGSRLIYDVKFDDGRRASFVRGKAPLKKL